MDDKENMCVCGVNRDILLAKGLAVLQTQVPSGEKRQEHTQEEKEEKTIF
jgi:hypothetical protein